MCKYVEEWVVLVAYLCNVEQRTIFYFLWNYLMHLFRNASQRDAQRRRNNKCDDEVRQRRRKQQKKSFHLRVIFFHLETGNGNLRIQPVEATHTHTGTLVVQRYMFHRLLLLLLLCRHIIFHSPIWHFCKHLHPVNGSAAYLLHPSDAREWQENKTKWKIEKKKSKLRQRHSRLTRTKCKCSIETNEYAGTLQRKLSKARIFAKPPMK